MRFMYWAVKKDGSDYHFMSESLLDVGQVIKDENGIDCTITDLAVDEGVSCAELKMAKEDMMYV